MKQHSLETTDIFRGAFFLCSGGRLADVRLKEDSRKIVSFLFEMEGIYQLDIVYRSGNASVNPLQFRESLNHLRDILFNKLREKAPASSRYERDYAAAGSGFERLRRDERRTRDDRERKDSGAQKEH